MTEFVTVQERTETHLSTAQAVYDDHNLNMRLSALVSSAHQVMYRERLTTGATIRRWLVETFPASFWSLRYLIWLSMAIMVVTAVVFAVWGHTNPAVIDQFMPSYMQDRYVKHDFVNYYKDRTSAVFFFQVMTNNVAIAIQTFGMGVLGGWVSLYILYQNSIPLGILEPLFASFGRSSDFWIHILPHGLLELNAICVATGAGIALGWSWINPGLTSRSQSMRNIGSIAFNVTLGSAIMLVVSGVIEGFITGAELPWQVRVASGVIVWVSFWVYVIIMGRNAHKRGLTGDARQTKRALWSIERQLKDERDALQAGKA